MSVIHLEKNERIFFSKIISKVDFVSPLEADLLFRDFLILPSWEVGVNFRDYFCPSNHASSCERRNHLPQFNLYVLLVHIHSGKFSLTILILIFDLSTNYIFFFDNTLS